MKYVMLATAEQDSLLANLEAMPELLHASFADVTAAGATRPGPDGIFSPVEQAWHLADLEREAFAVRIARLLGEADPRLPDFDGARVARERDYKSKSLAEGLAAFRQARRRNVATLRAIRPDAWTREGTQEGVGAVALCDLPVMMAQHDAAHREEIAAWRASGGAEA
jgi:hypothetical protein